MADEKTYVIAKKGDNERAYRIVGDTLSQQYSDFDEAQRTALNIKATGRVSTIVLDITNLVDDYISREGVTDELNWGG